MAPKRGLLLVRDLLRVARLLPGILHISEFSLHPSRPSLHSSRDSRNDSPSMVLCAGFLLFETLLLLFSPLVAPLTLISISLAELLPPYAHDLSSHSVQVFQLASIRILPLSFSLHILLLVLAVFGIYTWESKQYGSYIDIRRAQTFSI